MSKNMKITSTDALFESLPEITPASEPWEFIASDGKRQIFNPAEGYYPDKGSKFTSRPISFGSGSKYFSLSFDALCKERSHYYATFENSRGEAIVSDVYGSIEPADHWQSNRFCFSIRPDATSFRVGFQSLKSIRIKKVVVREVAVSEAVEILEQNSILWGDKEERRVPSFVKNREVLPDFQRILEEKRPCRIVLLGDSIINDIYNSVFQAHLDFHHPGNRVEILCSVRGSTGCWFYKEEENFKRFVADLRPDLLVIGGISHQNDLGALMETVAKAKASGMEVALLTGPMSDDWRTPAGLTRKALPKQRFVEHCTVPKLLEASGYYKQLESFAETEKIAYVDQFAFWHEYLVESEKPWQWFHRDPVHANDRGKFILGRMLSRSLFGTLKLDFTEQAG